MRPYRRPVAWALLFALLFVQLATAAYACTTSSVTSVEPATALDVASASSDCDSMQMAIGEPAGFDRPLCVDHCTHRTDATADVQLPAVHWLPVLVLAIVAPMPGDADPLVASSAAPSLARAVGPPLSILLGRYLS